MNALGLDIGGTAVKAALLGADGRVRLGVSEAYSRPDRDSLHAAIAQAVGRLEASPADVVGLCVPGRRSRDGRCVELAVNAPGLEGEPFERIVLRAVGRAVPFRVFGDAEAATADTAMDHPDRQRVLGIAVGTGIGVSLLVDGAPVGLAGSGIGHLGQIDVGPMEPEHPAGLVGPDGGRDSAEAYLGVPALQRRFGADFIARLADMPADDPAIRTLIRLIRIGLAVYTPDLVLILGGLGLALAPRAKAIDQAVRQDLTRVAPAGWQLAFGTCRHHAARGAARLAITAAKAEVLESNF